MNFVVLNDEKIRRIEVAYRLKDQKKVFKKMEDTYGPFGISLFNTKTYFPDGPNDFVTIFEIKE